MTALPKLGRARVEEQCSRGLRDSQVFTRVLNQLESYVYISRLRVSLSHETTSKVAKFTDCAATKASHVIFIKL